jgi:hypothetical protein
MMRAGVLAVVVALAVAAMAIELQDHEAQASAADRLVLSLGDRIRVDGAEVGCRVARLQGQGARVYVECRRAGPLEGSYGAYFGDERVLVVRFVDRKTARVVFTARHEGSARTCG